MQPRSVHLALLVPVLAALAPALGAQCLLDRTLASDGAANDQLGFSVAISAGTTAVGAPRDNLDRGAVYVSQQVAATQMWQELQKLQAADKLVGDQFGWSVAIDGDLVLVGARMDDVLPSPTGTPIEDAGSAYLFLRNASGKFTQLQQLIAFDAASADEFGYSVALQGDTAVIGSRLDDDAGSFSGSVYVYLRNPATGKFDFEQKLVASDAAAGDSFGFSVSLDADTLVVSAVGDDDNGSSSGSIYVFERFDSLSPFAQTGKLIASDGVAFDQLGYSVGVSGNRLVGGARLNQTGGTFSGAAYVFDRPAAGIAFTERQLLTPSNLPPNAEFGFSVAIDGDKIVVGAVAADIVIPNLDPVTGQPKPDAPFLGFEKTGAAYAYGFDPFSSAFVERAIVTTADFPDNFLPVPGERFGFSVDLDQGLGVVGAMGDGKKGPNAGAAYVLANGDNLPALLFANTNTMSVGAGGTQEFTLRLCPPQGLDLYLLLGSASGTTPGFFLDGQLVPLNPDVYFLFTINNPNSGPLQQSLGLLGTLFPFPDGQPLQQVKAFFTLLPNQVPGLVGLTLNHAYLIVNPSLSPFEPFIKAASNAVSLTFTP